MGSAAVESRIQDMFRQADFELQVPGRQLSIHPFIVGVENGKLSKNQIRAWAEQTYLYVLPAVPWIGSTYSRCDDEKIRDEIWKVLLEEATGQLSGTKSHPEIMADFAESVGADRSRLKTNLPLPATQALLNHWEIILCHRHWTIAMGGMGFGAERQIPVTFRKASNGLAKHYGIDEKGRRFFDIHISADEEHGDEAIEVIMRAQPTDAMLDQIHRSIISTAECMWNCWMSFESARN